MITYITVCVITIDSLIYDKRKRDNERIKEKHVYVSIYVIYEIRNPADYKPSVL